MSAYFNTNFLATLKTGFPAGVTQIRLYLFPQAPALDTGDGTISSAYAAIDRVGDLSTKLGWGPYIQGPAANIQGGTSDPSLPATTHVLATEDFALSDIYTEETFPPTRVMALVFATAVSGPTTDQIIFATDSPILGEHFIIDHRDGFVPAEASPTGRLVLFSWSDVPVGSPVDVLPSATEGTVRLDPGTPDFETARTMHCWIYPQRVNFIANPSFELGGDYWRSNGSIQQIPDSPPGGGNFAGRVSATAGTIILESNLFPLIYGRRSEQGMTIQLKVRGVGQMKIGLVRWDDNYDVTSTDWGPEPTWNLGSGYTNLRTLREIGEGVRGMLRVEFRPGGGASGWFDIDQVCVEPGLLPANENDWPYFDGYSEYGAPGDFSWYGGVSRHHATYSCWYNLRYSTLGRLFAWNVDTIDPTHYTDEEAALQGLANQWVPAGVPPVMSHPDVLYPNDPVAPLAPVSGTPIPYRTSDTDLLGVASPW